MTSSRDLERLVRVEAEDLLGGGDLVVAQRRAVHAAGVHLRRRGIADDRAHRDERRLVGDGLGRLDRLLDADDVLAALDLLHVPAVGAVAGRDVLGQRDVGVVLDGDLVVVVEHDQVAELLGARQRRRLAGDALLDVAVGGDHVDEVVERAGARRGVRVEQAALVARRHRHPDRRGQALAQRAGGDLHALGVPELRVARRLGLPGPQRLDVGRARGRNRRGRAGCTGSGWSARRTARTGRGPASARRSGRGASAAGTACRPAAPGSSRCRGGRCRPSAPRRRPAPGRCRRPASRRRSSRRDGWAGSGQRSLRVWSRAHSLDRRGIVDLRSTTLVRDVRTVAGR